MSIGEIIGAVIGLLVIVLVVLMRGFLINVGLALLGLYGIFYGITSEEWGWGLAGLVGAAFGGFNVVTMLRDGDVFEGWLESGDAAETDHGSQFDEDSGTQYLNFFERAPGVCPDCDSIKVFPGLNGADGKCNICHGTGLGSHLDQFAATLVNEDSECWKCSGTGQCQTCGGSGVCR